jgi:hypothetical protein
MASLTLLTLPAELRSRILSYCLPPDPNCPLYFHACEDTELVAQEGFTPFHRCHSRIAVFRDNQPRQTLIPLVNKQLYNETIGFYSPGTLDWHFCSVICANHFAACRIVNDKESALIGWVLRVHCRTDLLPEIKISERTVILDYINEMDRRYGYAVQRYHKHLDYMLEFHREQIFKNES